MGMQQMAAANQGKSRHADNQINDNSRIPGRRWLPGRNREGIYMGVYEGARIDKQKEMTPRERAVEPG
jgi:hypothetical protein